MNTSAAAIARRDRLRGFTDADVIKMLDKRTPTFTICAQFKISYGLFRRIARRNGRQYAKGIFGCRRDTDWPEEAERKLIALWDVKPKISCEKIGEQLGYSKNAVVGKAGRLNLPKRPGNGRPTEGPRGRTSDAELRRMAREKIENEIRRKQAASRARKSAVAAAPPPPPPAPEPEPEVVVAAPPPPPAVSRPPPTRFFKAVKSRGECCWPIGEPGAKGFRYCDEETERGAPYCTEHCRAGYTSRKAQPGAARA